MTKLLCPQCGKERNEGDKHCSNCNYPFDDQKDDQHNDELNENLEENQEKQEEVTEKVDTKAENLEENLEENLVDTEVEDIFADEPNEDKIWPSSCNCAGTLKEEKEEKTKEKSPKGIRNTLLIIVILALIFLGIGGYFYTKEQKEEDKIIGTVASSSTLIYDNFTELREVTEGACDVWGYALLFGFVDLVNYQEAVAKYYKSEDVVKTFEQVDANNKLITDSTAEITDTPNRVTALYEKYSKLQEGYFLYYNLVKNPSGALDEFVKVTDNLEEQIYLDYLDVQKSLETLEN